MLSGNNKATIHFAGNDLFIGITPSGHAVTLDTNSNRSAAPSPMELLLLALGTCTATDVASILAKKREQVTAYSVEVMGERNDGHPRGYKRLEVRHIVEGRNIAKKSVADAIRLSEEKYCSVAATLSPAAEILSTYEIIER